VRFFRSPKIEIFVNFRTKPRAAVFCTSRNSAKVDKSARFSRELNFHSEKVCF
jgi:hypothetical protein